MTHPPHDTTGSTNGTNGPALPVALPVALPRPQGRAALKASARQAAFAWLERILGDLDEVVAGAGVGGLDPVVVFEGTFDLDGTEDDLEWEQREELVEATLATSSKKAVWSPTHGRSWPTLVELWADLREALSMYYGAEIPASLLVDLTGHVVYCYEPWYCPDLGPEPIGVFEVVEGDEVDPFVALLSAEDDAVRIDRRLEELLETHKLTAPTQPGHEPGACGD